MQHTFTYGRNKYISAALVCVFYIFVGCMFAFGKFRPEDWWYAVIYLSPVTVMAAFSIIAWLDVVITEDGVRKTIFGFGGWFLSWRDIRAVRVTPNRNGDWGCMFLPRSRSIFSAILVQSSLGDIETFVDVVNEQLHRRGIPVQQWNGNKLHDVEGIPGKGRT
jgi:hypothetical protein